MSSPVRGAGFSSLPNEIFAARISRFLQKFLSLKGFNRTTLGGELLPVLPMWSGVENRYLDSWNRYAAAYQQALNAAANSGIRVRNPSNSGVICVFEKIMMTNNTGGAPSADQPLVMLQRPAAADLATVFANPIALDARTGTQSASVVWSHANTVAQTGNFIWFGQLTTTIGFNELIVHEDEEIPLLPGDSLTFLSNQNNINLNVNVMWRERALEDSEKF